MDYVIECRPSGQFIEALSHAKLNELSTLFNRLVFFASNISCTDGPGPDDVEPMVNEAMDEVRKSLPPSLRLDIGRIDVREGSVIILIFVIPVAVAVGGPVVGGGVAVGSLGLWALDKFFGGALEEFGKVFARNLMDKISKWWQQRGKQPSPITTINPREIAEGEAQRVSSGHNCKPALLTGGVRVGDHLYEYVYQLYECSHQLLTIRVNSQIKDAPVDIFVY
jgi:hypothetical protein